MARELYERCTLCDGTGRPKVGTQHDCPACEPLRVIPIGLTAGQVDRMARRELAEAEARAGLSEIGRG